MYEKFKRLNPLTRACVIIGVAAAFAYTVVLAATVWAGVSGGIGFIAILQGLTGPLTQAIAALSMCSLVGYFGEEYNKRLPSLHVEEGATV